MITGCFYFSESQKLFEFMEGVFCSSLDFGESRAVGGQFEPDEGEEGVKEM